MTNAAEREASPEVAGALIRAVTELDELSGRYVLAYLASEATHSVVLRLAFARALAAEARQPEPRPA